MRVKVPCGNFDGMQILSPTKGVAVIETVDGIRQWAGKKGKDYTYFKKPAVKLVDLGKVLADVKKAPVKRKAPIKRAPRKRAAK